MLMGQQNVPVVEVLYLQNGSVTKDIQRAATVVYRQPVTQDVQFMFRIAGRREVKGILWGQTVIYPVTAGVKSVQQGRVRAERVHQPVQLFAEVKNIGLELPIHIIIQGKENVTDAHVRHLRLVNGRAVIKERQH